MTDDTPKKLADLGAKLGLLLARKNEAYGSAFAKTGEFLRILWPEGVPPAALDMALIFARIFDKMMRLSTDPVAFGESPAIDGAGYFLLLALLHGRGVEGIDLPDVGGARVLLTHYLRSNGADLGDVRRALLLLGGSAEHDPPPRAEGGVILEPDPGVVLAGPLRAPSGRAGGVP